MARHFGPIAVPKNIEPWLYNALNRLNEATEQNTASLDAVGRGEAPDGSGLPIFPDLTNYFYLPGRQGGQIGHGATESGGFLKLRSTINTTRGKIYIGSQDVTAYDDLNDRFGIKTASPTATLHIQGEGASVLSYRPSAVVTSNGGWAVSGAATGPDCIDELVADEDTTFIFNVAASANAQDVYRIVATTPPVTTGHYLRIRAKRVGATARNLPFTLINGDNSAVICTGTIALDTSYATYYKDGTTTPIALTGAEQAIITNYANIHVKFGNLIGWAGGYPQDVVRVTWVELELPGTAGSSVGMDAKTVIVRAASTQSASLTEWQTSAGTSLITVSSTGLLTIESGGSFRHVPGAAASTLFLGDVDGDAAWGKIALLSAYQNDVVASAPVLGRIIYANSTPAWQTLAGNITAVRQFLSQTGTGSVSAAPVWTALAASDIPATISLAELRLIETGGGTDYIGLFAPAAVGANRAQLLFDGNGTIPIVGNDPPAVAARAMGKVDATAQVAAIASTNLTNGAAVGYYEVFYTLETTTADAGAVSVQVQIGYTDDIGATTQAGAALPLTVQGRDRGSFQVYLASGELSYQTNVVTIGTAQYALRLRVMYLG